MPEQIYSTFSNFSNAINYTIHRMKAHGKKFHRDQWQGNNVASRPEAVTFELHHVVIKVPVLMMDLQYLRKEIEPNLPWADNHFEERVSGNPLNPGKEWANWPWGKSADKARIDPQVVRDPGPDKIFDHTYSQRYWPKHAGMFSGGILDGIDLGPIGSNKGIYFTYGDLNDVVTELEKDPSTRQAILPVFFPEDTGYRPGRRKPCSLFYHFMLVGDRLDISYQLRSCDITHHFRDDIYLTTRLLVWVINKLRLRNSSFWSNIQPGDFIMGIANLHCFINDYNKLTQEKDNG